MTNKPAPSDKRPPAEQEEKPMRFDVEQFARSLKYRNTKKGYDRLRQR